jgi:Fic family protein
MIHYLRPGGWIRYDHARLVDVLTKAKAAVLSLQTVPFQRRWVDALQRIELKREVAGTSRIEGAEFTERELDAAMKKEETPDELRTRSQRQARAALKAYEWIKQVPTDRPLNKETVLTIHRLMIQNADEDHCPPGKLRELDQNVTFGSPAHRGVDGGSECEEVFDALASALDGEFKAHDPLIQAIAAHYHLAAMHPFLDGNGRTARALEALLLGRAGLRDTTFISMSNYYYDEKIEYLGTLAAVRRDQHDLTPFLQFALRGVELQARRLLNEIQREIKRELFANLMWDLFGRLKSPRKRVIAERQIRLLKTLLREEEIPVGKFVVEVLPEYKGLKNPNKGVLRDLNGLLALGTIRLERRGDPQRTTIQVDLDWPAKITETEFFERVRKMPKAREARAQWGIEA